MSIRTLLTVTAMALSACASGPTAEPGPDVQLLSGGEVTIADRLKVCAVDADCVLVATGCDDCCQQQAVHERFVRTFQDGFANACRAYSGGVCDCTTSPLVARCTQSTCETVLLTPPLIDSLDSSSQ